MKQGGGEKVYIKENKVKNELVWHRVLISSTKVSNLREQPDEVKFVYKFWHVPHARPLTPVLQTQTPSSSFEQTVPFTLPTGLQPQAKKEI